MNILIVTQYFYPEEFRINEVVKSLKNNGNKITIISGLPNYPQGKIYKGYKSLIPKIYEYNSCTVYRVPILSRGKSKIKLSFNYFSFVLSASFFGFWFIKNKNFDFVYCYAPSPLLQAIPGIIFSKSKKIPFILNVQDIWPESISATGNIKNKYILNLINILVSKIYKNSSYIFVPSKSFKKSIEQYKSSEKIYYIPNSVDKIFLLKKPFPDQELDTLFSNCFSCVFAGNLGQAQDLDVIIDAAKKITSYNDIRIIIFGEGNRYKWLKAQKNKYKLSNLYIMGRYPMSKMPNILLKSSCLLITLKNNEIFKKTIPNKLQAYLALGRPIIGSISGEGAEIINESGAGLICNHGSERDLADSILFLKSLNKNKLLKMGQKGNTYFNKHFDHDKLINQMENIFLDLINK